MADMGPWLARIYAATSWTLAIVLPPFDISIKLSLPWRIQAVNNRAGGRNPESPPGAIYPEASKKRSNRTLPLHSDVAPPPPPCRRPVPGPRRPRVVSLEPMDVDAKAPQEAAGHAVCVGARRARR